LRKFPKIAQVTVSLWSLALFVVELFFVDLGLIMAAFVVASSPKAPMQGICPEQ
jgi:hypothetical protein